MLGGDIRFLEESIQVVRPVINSQDGLEKIPACRDIQILQIFALVLFFIKKYWNLGSESFQQ